MPLWEFEPGHTSAEFAVRHMMVTIVRGHFKNLKGRFDFDPRDSAGCFVEATIDAASFTTAEPDRDAHLRSADFLDVASHPTITFKSTSVEATGTNHCKVTGDRKSTRLNSSHSQISYAVFCLNKKNNDS